MTLVGPHSLVITMYMSV